ncbi:MAG: hypothetical protein KR126chlam3_00844 [Chlamydiae bacterium]|nr:hypothetical protein [Chlamydiota bacterium]
MSAGDSSRIGLPEVTSNRLGDALKWLKLGDCLILCTKGGKKEIFKHIFHHCVYKTEGEKRKIEDIPLDSLRVIYIVVHPETLEKWQRVFEAARHQTCVCNIQKKIHSANSEFPYQYEVDI